MTGFQWVGVLLEKTVVWSLTIIELIVADESFILQYIFAYYLHYIYIYKNVSLVVPVQNHQ